MSEQDVEVVRSGYDAFARGDIPGVLANLDPEAQWTEPGGGNAPVGTFGADEVAEKVFGPVQENFDEFAATPEKFDDQGDTIVVTGKYTGKNKSGAELDSSFEHTYRMRDGKILSLDSKVDEAWAAGWS